MQDLQKKSIIIQMVLNVVVVLNIDSYTIFYFLGPGASSGRREDSMDTDQKQVLEFVYIFTKISIINEGRKYLKDIVIF